MAQLIDTYINDTTEIVGTWYIAKPLNKQGFMSRLKDAIGILKGDLTAVYFYQDEVDTWCEVMMDYDKLSCNCIKNTKALKEDMNDTRWNLITKGIAECKVCNNG